MNPTLLICLLATTGISILAERLGAPLTLALTFKGDVKRETRWLAQYGQAICTAVAALLVFRLDRTANQMRAFWSIVIAVTATSLVAFAIKRLAGRARPGREQAGRFLGPSLHHANWRESFPSSHSASAFALSVVLAHFYPQAGDVFWALAIICAVLRYIMDAHWPSDVLAGITLGYLIACLTLQLKLT
jgi:membrane-associated phospholipid phosphatase